MLAPSLNQRVTLRSVFLTKLERTLKKTVCYLLETRFKLETLRLRSQSERKRACLRSGRLGWTTQKEKLGHLWGWSARVRSTHVPYALRSWSGYRWAGKQASGGREREREQRTVQNNWKEFSFLSSLEREAYYLFLVPTRMLSASHSVIITSVYPSNKCTSTLEEWAATIVFTLLPFCKLIGMKMLSCLCMRAKSVQSCPTLYSPMDYSLPGSSIHGIFQVRIVEWVAMPSSKGSSDPGIKPMSQVSCISRWVLGH